MKRKENILSSEIKEENQKIVKERKEKKLEYKLTIVMKYRKKETK